MERVYGVETEYGLSARVGGRRLSAPEAAELLFRPVVAEQRSSNVFLPNGGRLYLDVGAHPEYATPECRTVRQLLAAERAGDELVARLALDAAAAAAETGTTVRFRLFKNNADSFGNSYGCHENYLVSRELDLPTAAELLTPFLVSRQILCGSGRLQRGEFLVSQRADHLHEQLSAHTTRTRPLVNTRDEPLADPVRFRRLHILAGDSNLAEFSAWLKVGTTAAVLELLDRPEGSDRRLTGLRLANPSDAIRRTARDPLARLDLADGRSLTAVDLQRTYLDLASEHADPALAELWERVLDALAAGTPELVADKVEWIAKRRLLEEYRHRHGLAADHPRLAQLDLAFHELGGLFAALEAGGAVARLTTSKVVTQAIGSPPSATRAAARASFIRAARQRGWEYTVDWQTCRVRGLAGADGLPSDRTVALDDPLAATNPELEELLETVRSR